MDIVITCGGEGSFLVISGQYGILHSSSNRIDQFSPGQIIECVSLLVDIGSELHELRLSIFEKYLEC